MATNVELVELQVSLKTVLMRTRLTQEQVSKEAQAMGYLRQGSALCRAYYQTLQAVL